MNQISPEQMLKHDPVIKKTLELSPDEVYARGYAAWQQQDYDRARVDFSWMVMTQPWCWHAHIALAGVLMMQKEFVLAINYYGYALMLNPCNPESVYQMAVCLKEMGEFSEARVALQTTLTMSYEDPSYSTVRANAEQMLSQLLV